MKLITLYEIRLFTSYGTENLGNRKLRTLPRARRLAKRLRRMGVKTELCKWRVNPAGLKINNLTSRGWAVETTANRGAA